MKTIMDMEMAVWLRDSISGPDGFDWDDGNEHKNAKHGVTREDVESIIDWQKNLFMGRIIEPKHSEWRGILLGITDKGRMLSLIFTRRGNKLRPISCRPMRSEERRLYEEKIKAYS